MVAQHKWKLAAVLGGALLCCGAVQLSGARAALVQSEGLGQGLWSFEKPIEVTFALLCDGTGASCDQRGHGTANGRTQSLLDV